MYKLCIITCIITSSCVITENYRNTKNTQQIIELQRTACFGTCPIYRIQIFSDGTGIYNGKKFVENIGEIRFQISKEEIKNILEFAKRIKFSEMKDEYYEAISDLPTTYVTIKEKSIKDYVGSPKELRKLEELIDQICLKAIKN